MERCGETKPRPVVVTRNRTTVVTPEVCTGHEEHPHREPLSNFDLIITEQYVNAILCYDKPNVGFDSMVSILKASLAKTLVEYYVFAAELVCNNSSKELEILCNNHGVDFIEACADMELGDIDVYKPDGVIGEQLAPELKDGNTLSIQITEFSRCGSVVIVCKFDHRVADVYATNMFLTSWSENALSKPLSYRPSRLLFTPRSPLRHGPEVEKFYAPRSSLPPPFIKDENEPYTSRIYYVKAEQIMSLQEAASTETYKRTKLESFSAFLWQLLAKSALHENKCKDQTEKSMSKEELITTMGIVVDGRTRLTSAYDSQSCTRYFGNVLSALTVSETVETIRHKSLTWIGQRVAQVIKEGANEDHFLGLIDMVERVRPEKLSHTDYWPRSTDGPKVILSSGLRFPLGKINFGWGRPLLGFYSMTCDHVNMEYVMPMPTPKGDGDWLVFVHLPVSQIEFIEKEAAHVFRPCTLDIVSR